MDRQEAPGALASALEPSEGHGLRHFHGQSDGREISCPSGGWLRDVGWRLKVEMGPRKDVGLILGTQNIRAYLLALVYSVHE